MDLTPALTSIHVPRAPSLQEIPPPPSDYICRCCLCNPSIFTCRLAPLQPIIYVTFDVTHLPMFTVNNGKASLTKGLSANRRRLDSRAFLATFALSSVGDERAKVGIDLAFHANHRQILWQREPPFKLKFSLSREISQRFQLNPG